MGFLPTIMCPKPSGCCPGARGCHKEEHTHHRAPAVARLAAEENWGQAQVWGSRFQIQWPQWDGRVCVYFLCPNSK